MSWRRSEMVEHLALIDKLTPEQMRWILRSLAELAADVGTTGPASALATVLRPFGPRFDGQTLLPGQLLTDRDGDEWRVCDDDASQVENTNEDRAPLALIDANFGPLAVAVA